MDEDEDLMVCDECGGDPTWVLVAPDDLFPLCDEHAADAVEDLRPFESLCRVVKQEELYN